MPVFRDVHFERPELQVRTGVFAPRPDRVPRLGAGLHAYLPCAALQADVLAHQAVMHALYLALSQCRRLGGSCDDLQDALDTAVNDYLDAQYAYDKACVLGFPALDGWM
jgi:hypothetical protein